jgi:hypothetical protein
VRCAACGKPLPARAGAQQFAEDAGFLGTPNPDAFAARRGVKGLRKWREKTRPGLTMPEQSLLASLVLAAVTVLVGAAAGMHPLIWVALVALESDAILGAVVCYQISKEEGQADAGWWLLGLVLGALGVLVTALHFALQRARRKGLRGPGAVRR